MTPAQFESIKRYVAFDESAERALHALFPVAQPHFAAIVGDFYDAIEAHPEAMAAITGGTAQVERLKKSLTTWLTELLSGPYDDAYLQKHSRIGRVHVQIDLPQEFMFTAINRIRTQLHEVVRTSESVAIDDRSSLTRCVDQILDLELAIMLDTYREHFVEAIRVGERLSTLGQLSTAIAHELRNPLGVIESSLFLIEKHLEGSRGTSTETTQKHFDRIRAQVDACGQTIRHMLDLARDRPLAVREVGVRTLLERVVADASLAPGIRVEIVADPTQSVEVDPSQFSTALQNLVKNAGQALGTTGQIRIEASRHAGDTWITVTDDGPGIAPDIRSRAFHALFTTKESAIGLGLPVARRIAELHGGELALVPVDHGACLRLSIPTRSRVHVGEES